MSKITSIGGQALIEGILMRGPKKTTVAVRMPDGSIDVSDMEEKHLRDKHKVFGLPVIRGVVNFIESLVTGYKAIMISAEKSGYTDFEEEAEKTPESEKKNEALKTGIMIVATVLGVGLALVLFMLIPRLVVGGLRKIFATDFSAVAKSSIEQAIKLIVFVLYVWAVSFMKDIRRVFMYHGAEHKTIFCYEAGEELTVENVRKHKRFHPRCGTSFMILMIIVSLVVSTVVQILFKGIYESVLVWTLIKLLLIPVVCGLGYELLKVCGRHDNVITRIISAPGMWLQRITTKEPDDSMIEIAIASVKEVIPENTEDDKW